MAVYVIPRRNVYGGVLGNLGNGLMNYVFGGMMARDAQARQARRSRGLWDDMSRMMKPQPGLPQPEAPRPQYSEDVQNIANAATRGMPTATDNQGWKGLWDSTVGLGKEYRPGREELLGVFGRHGVTPQEAELAMNFYKNQFETADKLGYQDNVASRVGGLDYDVRGNAPNAARSAAVAGAYGIDMAPVYERTAPQFSFSSADLGDRLGYFTQDPLTGEYGYRAYNYDVNPTKRYESDADTRQENIRAAADRYVADTNLRGDIINASGRSAGSGQGVKPLTLSDKKNIGDLVFQNLQLAETKDGFNQQAFEQWLNSAFGDNPEAMAYARSIVGMPQYEQNNIGMKIPRTNPYQPTQQGEELGTITPGQVSGQGQGQTQPQPQVQATGAYFPAARLEEYARANNMTPAQARQQIEAQGYAIR